MAADDNDTNQDLNEETLDASEGTDSDELGENVGDDGYEAPDGWVAANRTGTTAEEEREGETLDEKLAEERPDVAVEDNEDRPLAATPLDELDADVDEVVDSEAVIEE